MQRRKAFSHKITKLKKNYKEERENFSKTFLQNWRKYNKMKGLEALKLRAMNDVTIKEISFEFRWKKVLLAAAAALF